LIRRARVHTLIFTAVLDQQIAPLRVHSGIRRLVERVDFGIERGGDLPAQKAGFARQSA